jgi:hypothetical protein
MVYNKAARLIKHQLARGKPPPATVTPASFFPFPVFAIAVAVERLASFVSYTLYFARR